ncbi:hypothetical protein ACHAW6_003911 [Cyclotella cf. meneghiniana]
MLCKAWHRWSAGTHFVYNLIRHQCRLILRGPPGSPPALLLVHKGVMQGCIWGMILYGIGLMPLCRLDPSNLHPWYADNFAMEEPSSGVAALFIALCQKGPSIGYFPAPSKSWAICPHELEPSAHNVFKDSSIPVKFS